MGSADIKSEIDGKWESMMRILRVYALAALSVTIALILSLVIPSVRQHYRFVLFFGAVIVSAIGGRWPGVFAILLSMALADYFFFEPLHTFAFSDPRDLVPWLGFGGMGLAITWGIDRLHRSEEAARAGVAVIESSADSIFQTDLDNTILSWNEAAERAYGYTAEEAIGRPVSLIVPTDCMEELLGLSKRVQHGASFPSHETVHVAKDGRRIDVALTLSPVQDRHRRIVAMSIMVRDMTKGKLAVKALQESLEKQKLLVEMGSLLQACSIPADAYAVAARFAQALIPGGAGALYVHSTATKGLETVSRWGEWQPEEKELLAPDECWGLRTGRAHFVEDSHTNLLCRHLPDPPPTCYLCVPMIAHGEAVGLFHLRLGRRQQATSGAALQELLGFPWPATFIAEHMALALANMKLRDALLSQSIRDSLTGLFNRRYMEETLEREISRAARNRHPLAVIMLDIDNFKEFNDSFGHEAGDVALQNLCEKLKTHIRSEDIACRYGGDEFVLILPGTSPELAAQRAEELRTAAAHIDVQYQGRLLAPMALSCGVATFPENGRTLKDLLRACDTALRRAKSEGRIRVRSHEQG